MMIIKRIMAVTLFSFLCCSLSLANAETFKVGVHESPPLVFAKKSAILGIYKEIFIEISKITSDTFVFEYASPENIINDFDRGKIDIEPGINPLWRHMEKVPGSYTIPFAKSASVIVQYRPNKRAVQRSKNKSTQKLKRLKTGIVEGYQYPTLEQHFAKGEWEPVYLVDELAILTQLKLKKIDQAIIQQGIMAYYLHAKKPKEAHQFEVSDSVETRDIMMRVTPDKAKVIGRFNEAIKKLVESGTIKKIYDRYRFTG